MSKPSKIVRLPRIARAVDFMRTRDNTVVGPNAVLTTYVPAFTDLSTLVSPPSLHPSNLIFDPNITTRLAEMFVATASELGHEPVHTSVPITDSYPSDTLMTLLVAEAENSVGSAVATVFASGVSALRNTGGKSDELRSARLKQIYREILILHDILQNAQIKISYVFSDLLNRYKGSEAETIMKVMKTKVRDTVIALRAIIGELETKSPAKLNINQLHSKLEEIREAVINLITGAIKMSMFSSEIFAHEKSTEYIAQTADLIAEASQSFTKIISIVSISMANTGAPANAKAAQSRGRHRNRGPKKTSSRVKYSGGTSNKPGKDPLRLRYGNLLEQIKNLEAFTELGDDAVSEGLSRIQDDGSSRHISGYLLPRLISGGIGKQGLSGSELKKAFREALPYITPEEEAVIREFLHQQRMFLIDIELVGFPLLIKIDEAIQNDRSLVNRVMAHLENLPPMQTKELRDTVASMLSEALVRRLFKPNKN